MAQIKIYGLKEKLNPIKDKLSKTIHSCVIDAFQYPPEKRFHRFFPLDREDFLYAADRSDAYTIIEISIFEGRSQEVKKQLINLMFQRIEAQVGIKPKNL